VVTALKQRKRNCKKIPWKAIAAEYLPSRTGGGLQNYFTNSKTAILPPMDLLPAEIVAFAEQLVSRTNDFWLVEEDKLLLQIGVIAQKKGNW